MAKNNDNIANIVIDLNLVGCNVAAGRPLTGEFAGNDIVLLTLLGTLQNGDTGQFTCSMTPDAALILSDSLATASNAHIDPEQN